LIHVRLASGRLVDLMELPKDIDFATEIAAPLSRIARFAGQVPMFYSVAEHCVRGADAIIAEKKVPAYVAMQAALAFLLHDDHEAFAGDLTRPFLQLAEALEVGDLAGGASALRLRAAIERAKRFVSGRIQLQAGMPWPLPREIADLVKDMDNRMLAEEQRRLWPQPSEPDPNVAHLPPVDVAAWKTPGEAPCWSPARAAGEWMTRFNKWREVVA
jgi:hypothetical protein